MLFIYKENCNSKLPQGLEFMNSERAKLLCCLQDEQLPCYPELFSLVHGLFHYKLVTELIKVHQH